MEDAVKLTAKVRFEDNNNFTVTVDVSGPRAWFVDEHWGNLKKLIRPIMDMHGNHEQSIPAIREAIRGAARCNNLTEIKVTIE